MLWYHEWSLLGNCTALGPWPRVWRAFLPSAFPAVSWFSLHAHFFSCLSSEQQQPLALGGKLPPGIWEGRAWVQPFPPSRAAAGTPCSANPNLPAGVWQGEASAAPRSRRVCSPVGPAVPLWLCQQTSASRQPATPAFALCLPPLQQRREEKGSWVYLPLLCPL